MQWIQWPNHLLSVISDSRREVWKIIQLLICWLLIGNIPMEKKIVYGKNWTLLWEKEEQNPYIYTQIYCWRHLNVTIKAKYDLLAQQKLHFWEVVTLVWKSAHLLHIFQDILCIKGAFAEDYWVNVISLTSVFPYKHVWLLLNFNLDFWMQYL